MSQQDFVIYPNPTDSASCARFRLRRKSKRSPGRSSQNLETSSKEVGELWQTCLDLQHQVLDLQTMIIRQGQLMNDNLSVMQSIYTDLAKTVGTASMSFGAHVSPANPSSASPPPNSNAHTFDDSSVQPSLSSLAPSSQTSKAQSAASTVAQPSTHAAIVTQSRSTRVSSLPGLRGIFKSSKSAGIQNSCNGCG